MTEESKNLVWLYVLGVLAFVFLAWAIWTGVNKAEKNECLKWKNEAELYRPLYYLTGWQAEQCAAQGIEVDAPVIETKLQWEKKQGE